MSRALGGGKLSGDKLVRFVYLDESGTGNKKIDRYVVVAGALVNADIHWKKIEAYLRELADEFALPEDREGFIFHATELYSGGKVLTREKYSRDARWAALDALCNIPKKFDLPVVMGWSDRQELAARFTANTNQEVVTNAQAIASMGCAIGVERFMRNFAPTEEVATMVYEHHDHASRIVRETHNFMQSPDEGFIKSIPGEWADYMPFERIVETAHFARKKDTSILQLADACVFALRRKLEGLANADRFFLPIVDHLIVRPSEWAPK